MELIYSPLSLKNLQKINKKDLKKIKSKIEIIVANPLIGKHLKGDHLGEYSLRAWPLRIVYIFDSAKQIIEIVTVDYRGNVYK